MVRRLLPPAAALLLAACTTASMPNYGRTGCLRAGRDKAAEIGFKAGAASAPAPRAGDVASTLVAGVGSAVLRANGVSVGIVIARRVNPLDLCHPVGLMRGISTV